MLCFGYFFLLLLAAVFLTEVGGQALKIESDEWFYGHNLTVAAAQSASRS